MLHVPFEVVSVCPCCAVPLTTGNAVFAGGETTGAATVAVCADVALADPPELVAVTTASIP